LKNRIAVDDRGRPLWEGHRERLRQRMEREGWDSLKPYEMLELVLYHAVPRQDLSNVARLLVDRFGSVGGVFAAPREQLLAVPGMTPVLAEWIVITSDLMRAYRDLHAVSDIRLSCYQEVLAFLEPRIDPESRAGLWVLYADFNFNLITFTDLWEAGQWWDAANARRMMMEAIGNGARYVYLVIWVDGAPAGMNREEASRLESIASVLRAADLDLVDCVLVGREGVYSMNINGKMKNIRAQSGCLALHERYAEPPRRD